MIRGHRTERLAHRSRRWRLGPVLAVLAAVVFLAGCGGSTESNSGPAAHVSQEVPAAEGTAGGGAISPRLAAHFALLRTPAEGLPAAVERTLEPPVAGVDWNLARRVPVPMPGRYWLVPGGNYLCMVAVLPGSASVGTVCATVGQALRHGIVNTSVDPASSTRTMVGVVPGGTRSVIVRTGNSQAPASVRDGYFVVSDSTVKPPTEVILR
jgi:hypothetical protein